MITHRHGSQRTTLVEHILSLLLDLVIHARPPFSPPFLSCLVILKIWESASKVKKARGAGSKTACSKHWVKSRSLWDETIFGGKVQSYGRVCFEAKASKAAWAVI